MRGWSCSTPCHTHSGTAPSCLRPLRPITSWPISSLRHWPENRPRPLPPKRPANKNAGRSTSLGPHRHPLPDPASVNRLHRLTSLAVEGVPKLLHIAHHAVHAELHRRVRIGLHLHLRRLPAQSAAPVLPEGQEEPLFRREAIRFVVKVDVLALWGRQQSQ